MSPKALTHRSSLLSVRPLPQIHEDESHAAGSTSPDFTPPPSIPPRSLQRHSLSSNPSTFPASPLSSSPPASPSAFGRPPPPYTFPSTPYLTNDSKDTALASQQHRFRSRRGNPPPPWSNPSVLARRGGWYRLALVCLLLIALIIGLAVGLTLGLRSRWFSSSSASANQEKDEDTAVDFPLGSWSFATALTRTSSLCLPQTASQAWQCYPADTTYNTSASGSAVTWTWIITSSSAHSYHIASSPNPFAPIFANATVRTLDSSTPQERLVFSTTLETYAVLVPLPQQQQRLATCRYTRAVRLSATLWTKERAEFPSRSEGAESSSVKGNAKTFQPWPFRAEVQQTVDSGAAPECVDEIGRRVLAAELAGAGGGQCGCWYGNHGLGSGRPGRRWLG